MIEKIVLHAVRKYLTILILFTAVSKGFADQQGNTPGTFVSVNNLKGCDVQDWNSPGNVTAVDANYADVMSPPLLANECTDYLRLTNFGLSIPAGSTIDGVRVFVFRHANYTVTGIEDEDILLVVGGAESGDNKASTTDWTKTDVLASYGGVADLWGNALTPAIVNSADFGVTIAAKDDAGNLSWTVHIDRVNLIVYYTAPLPIELLNFSAMPDNLGQVHIHWSTGAEVNNEYFTVERSRDGSLFEEVGRLSGAGNSGSTLQYNYNDRPDESGIWYYRLRQTDYDGTTAISEIVSVNLGNSAVDILVNFDLDHAVLEVTVHHSACDINPGELLVMDIKGRVLQKERLQLVSDCKAVGKIRAVAMLNRSIVLLAYNDRYNSQTRKIFIN